MTLVTVECAWCGKEIKKKKKEYNRQLRNGRDYFFCDLSCAAKNNNSNRVKKKEKQAKENPITWNADIAYLTGLITSDGTLNKNRPRIVFINSEFELIEHVKNIVNSEITSRKYKVQKNSRDESVWWNYQFTSRKYYYFLKKIGLTPDKSLTIDKLDVPDQYFADFLRGEIDGDGSFFEYGTKFRCAIHSGSKTFLEWLFTKLKNELRLKGGWITKSSNVYKLAFAINDSIKIAEFIYYADRPKLTRKYRIVEKYLE